MFTFDTYMVSMYFGQVNSVIQDIRPSLAVVLMTCAVQLDDILLDKWMNSLCP